MYLLVCSGWVTVERSRTANPSGLDSYSGERRAQDMRIQGPTMNYIDRSPTSENRSYMIPKCHSPGSRCFYPA